MPSTVGIPVSSGLGGCQGGHEFNLNARTHGQLGNPKGRAGMLTPWAQHVEQQLTAAIGDQVLLGIQCRAVDLAHDFDDFIDLVQVLAHRQACSVQGAQ